MEAFFGVRFVATEHSTGQIHGGRIDSLGLATDGSPVIFEYKRHTNDNIVSQALYYRTWLLDHRGDYQILVHHQLGPEAAQAINWSNPRIVCIAGDFTKFDEHAVQEFHQPIELVRYRLYGNDLILFEWLTESVRPTTARLSIAPGDISSKGSKKKLTPGEHRRKEFSRQLLQRAQAHTSLHRNTRPGRRRDFTTGSGVPGIFYRYSINQSDSRAMIYIDRRNQTENEEVFNRLLSHREEIEREFGQTLEWERLPGVRASVIRLIIDGGYGDPEERWPDLQGRLIDAMVRLEKAFANRLPTVVD